LPKGDSLNSLFLKGVGGGFFIPGGGTFGVQAR
jgi:hypothetical protein